MHQTDYITRTIRQFSQMLAALLFGARDGGQVAFSDLDELSVSFTGISLDTLQTFSSSQIINLFSLTGEMDVDKVYVSARLLHQLVEESSEEEAAASRQKVLALLSEVYREFDGYLNDEHEALAQRLNVQPGTSSSR